MGKVFGSPVRILGRQMGDTTQLNLRLSVSTMGEWDAYVEDNTPFSSRSEFIRYAVTQEMNRGEDEETTDAAVTDEQWSELMAELSRVGDRLAEVEQQMDTMQRAVRDDPEIEELSNRLFPVLPDSEPGTRAWRDELENRQTQAQAEDEEESDRRLRAWEGTPEAFAEAFDEPTRRIHQALDKLISETHLVNTAELEDGTTRYYKEV